MKKIIIALLILQVNVLHGQVGIGSVTPNASALLDIQSSDKGMLIPRVALDDVTNNLLDGVNFAITSLLIYNSNPSVVGGDGTGFYFFNGIFWEKITSINDHDRDWFLENSVDVPQNITDDIYTQSKVAIGRTDPNHKLDIYSNSDNRALNIEITGATTGNIYGNYIKNSNIGSGIHYGTFNTLEGSGNGEIYASYQIISNTGSGPHHGTYNLLNGIGNGRNVGIENVLYGPGSGENDGTRNWLLGDSEGVQKGVLNEIYPSGNGLHYGVFNSMIGIGSGNHYGVWNDMGSSGAGDQFGNRTEIRNTGDGTHYGTYNLLTGTGSGNKYGFYSSIPNTAGGNHYGIYSNVTKSGSYSGYFIGKVEIDQGNFVVSGNSLFVDNTTQSVGIGTNSPTEKLVVNGKIKAIDVNFSGLPTYADDATAGTGRPNEW